MKVTYTCFVFLINRLPLDSREITENDESFILIHSLRDANMPKFLAEDVPLFESILDDLFPGVIPPVQDHGALEVQNDVVSETIFIDTLKCLENKEH